MKNKSVILPCMVFSGCIILKNARVRDYITDDYGARIPWHDGDFYAEASNFTEAEQLIHGDIGGG